MNEKQFQNEIRSSIQYLFPAAHYVKIPDPSKMDINQTNKRPYDAYYIFHNVFIAFEYKQIKEAKSFPFDRVENHQVYNLLEVNQGFNHGYVLINYRFSLTEKQMKKLDTQSKKHNFSVLLDISYFVLLRNFYLGICGKKSLPFEVIWKWHKEGRNTIIFWEKMKDKHIWNLKNILQPFWLKGDSDDNKTSGTTQKA